MDLEANNVDAWGVDATGNLTVGQIPDARVDALASATQGDTLYRGAAQWDQLGIGTAGQVLATNAGTTAPEWVTPGEFTSIGVQIPLTFYIDENLRQLDQHIHGAFGNTSIADTLDSGTPIVGTVGLGKVFVSVVAGSDVSGTITVTGTDR